jgi:hypothetical protein
MNGFLSPVFGRGCEVRCRFGSRAKVGSVDGGGDMSAFEKGLRRGKMGIDR